ncbi:hypothetical protein E1A91_A07G197100v1 [Gossypium mustelinum]|uniref:Protein TIC 40, chloroplastic n=1 Tax=Gossypium mustelinum TaxID=34275 RepID=A0A5D2YNL6_GOSMU|nr:hypothetical protein E1A91_A07G197100v1 [Gossypium mustelinum]
MENLNMALVSSSSLSYSSPPKLFPLGYNNPNYTLKNPTKTFLFRTSKIAPRSSRIPNSAHASPLPPLHPQIEKSMSIYKVENNSMILNILLHSVPCVIKRTKALSWLVRYVTILSFMGFCFVAELCHNVSKLWSLFLGMLNFLYELKMKYVMQQAFKTMTGQMNTQNNQFGNTVFPLGSPFPFPAPPSAGPDIPRSPSSQCTDTVDAPVRQVEAASVTDPATEVKSVKNETETAEPKKYAFVDVSPKETMHKSAFEDAAELSSPNGIQSSKDLSDNGAASKQDAGAFGGFQASRGAGPTLSVDALEKMLEDPTVQKMLPEEMRNPETFKWMLQNPQYRQQLQDMLNNTGGTGSTEWDNRIMESLKDFDLNSPEVKQQFVIRWSNSLLLEYGLAPEEDQIGLTPEEVISKIMANPEVAMAFQNPRVQAAIMDCSQNPLSIAKYQNDKEVMDVVNKISELFPGVTGPP